MVRIPQGVRGRQNVALPTTRPLTELGPDDAGGPLHARVILELAVRTDNLLVTLTASTGAQHVAGGNAQQKRLHTPSASLAHDQATSAIVPQKPRRRRGVRRGSPRVRYSYDCPGGRAHKRTVLHSSIGRAFGC